MNCRIKTFMKDYSSAVNPLLLFFLPKSNLETPRVGVRIPPKVATVSIAFVADEVTSLVLSTISETSSKVLITFTRRTLKSMVMITTHMLETIKNVSDIEEYSKYQK